MKPHWQLVNLLESPAAHGKQSLVDPVPYRPLVCLWGGRKKSKNCLKGQKGSKDSHWLPHILSLFLSIPSTSIHGPPWATPWARYQRCSLLKHYPFTPTVAVPFLWNGEKRWYALTLQLRKSDTASQVAKSSLPPGLSPIRGMLLLCMCIRGGEQKEQDVFPSSLILLPSPTHKTTTTIATAYTRLGECSDGLEISEGNWKTKLLSRSNSS